jgi:hypothetical protein
VLFTVTAIRASNPTEHFSLFSSLAIKQVGIGRYNVSEEQIASIFRAKY